MLRRRRARSADAGGRRLAPASGGSRYEGEFVPGDGFVAVREPVVPFPLCCVDASQVVWLARFDGGRPQLRCLGPSSNVSVPCRGERAGRPTLFVPMGDRVVAFDPVDGKGDLISRASDGYRYLLCSSAAGHVAAHRNRTVATLRWEGAVDVLECDSGRRVAVVGDGDRLHGRVWQHCISPSTLYVSCCAEGDLDLWRMSLATLDLERAGPAPHHLTMAHSELAGRLALCTVGSTTFMENDGTTVWRELPGFSFASFSPDGTQAAGLTDSATLALYSLADGRVDVVARLARRAEQPDWHQTPAWSRDGRWLATSLVGRGGVAFPCVVDLVAREVWVRRSPAKWGSPTWL